jgi:hypothetical protein
MSVETYWNGEPAECRIVRVVVGPAPLESWWCAKLAGTVRDAVRVDYNGDTFYLDNEDGRGWTKVTSRRGSPFAPSRSLPVAHEIGAPAAAIRPGTMEAQLAESFRSDYQSLVTFIDDTLEIENDVVNRNRLWEMKAVAEAKIAQYDEFLKESIVCQ